MHGCTHLGRCSTLNSKIVVTAQMIREEKHNKLQQKRVIFEIQKNRVDSLRELITILC